MNKTISCLVPILPCLASSVGFYRYCVPTAVLGRRLLRSSRSPRPREPERFQCCMYVIRNYVVNCICKRLVFIRRVLIEICIVFPRARGAHATRTTPCSTRFSITHRLPIVQTAATTSELCLSGPPSGRDHKPPLSLAPQAQSVPTPRSPPGPCSLHVHVHPPPPCFLHLSRSPF